MNRDGRAWTVRLALGLLVLGAAVLLAGHTVRAQDMETEPAAESEAADEPEADGADEPADTDVEGDDTAADADGGADDTAADDRDAASADDDSGDADADATSDAPDDDATDDSAGDDDGAAALAEDEFFDDGSTAADEFMTSDWAPEVVVVDADDSIPADTQLDPSGAGWEVVAGDAGPSPDTGHPPLARVHRGDYAGPAEILVMRPRARTPGERLPGGPRPQGEDKDTAYSYGGRPIAPGSAPWQAQIYRSSKQPAPGIPRWKAQHNCGGAFIAPGWILTAAHCIDDIVDDRDAGWRVRLGGQDLSKEDGVTYAVDRWVRHSGYRNVGHPKAPQPPRAPPNMYANDIGLVHIQADAQTKPLADPRRVQPIQLYRQPVQGGDEITAIGWGMTQNAEKSFSAVPLKVDLRVMDTATCQARPGYGPERINGRVICAAREGRKTCRGDSGGPVVLTNGITANLVGLVSWGKSDCSGDGKPSVFTRLESHLAWIEQAMKLPQTRASLP